MENSWYLKPNVVIEPLVDRWYAWAHLISPATAAMNIRNRHLKILNSYIQNHKIHEEASKNPKMKGGPFIDFNRERVEEAKCLRDETLQKRACMLELVESIAELNKILKKSASGYAMETLYKEVPEPLKGYVELVYDLNHNPSFRFFEKLLYKSKYYDESAQSIALWITNNDERPFVLSTPRLEDDHVLHVEIPFRHEVIDELSRMRRHPGDKHRIAEMLGITSSHQMLFDTLFTQDVPEAYKAYKGDKIRMRYFGHACVLIETEELSILVDPVISYHGYSSDVSRYSEADLPDQIDYVLITHNHQDHVMLETLLSLRHKIKQIVVPANGNGSLQDPSVKLMLEELGFMNVIELKEFETSSQNNCEIMSIPFMGEHSDLDIKAKSCYHVKIGQYTLLFVADSCNIEPKLYQYVTQLTGSVDCVFLGMECDGAPLSWLYGPLLTETLARDMDMSRRLAGSNYERGKALIDVFNPKEVYVYAMGMEPWLEYISSIKYTDESRPIIESNHLVKSCHDAGIVAERLFGEKELFYDIYKSADLASESSR